MNQYADVASISRNNIHLAVLYGSTREDRFCDTVGDWLIGQLQSIPDFTLDLIDSLRLTPSSF